MIKMLYREPLFWPEVSHITTRSFGSSSFLAIITSTHILKADGGNVLSIPTGPFWGPLSYAFSTIRLHIRETHFHACSTELSFCHLWFQFSPSLWQKHTLISVGQHLRNRGSWRKKNRMNKALHKRFGTFKGNWALTARERPHLFFF